MYFLAPILLLLPTLARVQAKPTVATAWFAGWHAAESEPAFTVDDIAWDRFTELTYSFAETTPDVRKLDISGSEPQVLPQFVTAAHAHGVKAKVSIGGWTGSRWFSTAVGSAANRTLFVKTITDFATKFNLDGIDIDWEYPNLQGIGCNTINTHDSANLLAMLQELRANPVGAKLVLSAAVVTPFRDASGNPSRDVSAFAKVLDYVAIMNYDINGPWSAAAAANAPLNDTCAPEDFQEGSAVDFVGAWINAGFPANQIVLGVASYGHSFAVAQKDAFTDAGKTKLALFPPFDANRSPAGDEWDDQPGVDECGVFETQGGIINFWGLIEQRYLNANGTAKAGVPYLFDTCSQTPFVYNTTTQVMISFDDPRSFAVKGAFIKSRGLAGFSMWEAGADPNVVLVDSIRSAAGF